MPDLFLVRKGRPHNEEFAEGADLAIEVTIEGRESRERDIKQKRTEYAAAGIPEYWIVDPQEQVITVLGLDHDQYRVHGEYKPGKSATSVRLAGFTVNVADCFAAAEVE